MEVYWLEILLLLGTAALALTLYIKWVFSYWDRRKVPYLKPIFPWGNFEAPWGIKKGFHEVLIETHKELKSKGYKYGGVYSTVKPIFVPVDLDLLKDIMIKDFQHFVDRGIYYNEKHDPLSAHLLTLEGDKWRNLRSKLSPTFTSGKMKVMFPLMQTCGEQLEREVDKLCNRKQNIDIKHIATLYTTNVIGVCAFGLECNSFEDLDKDFVLYSQKLFDFGGFFGLLWMVVTTAFPDLCKKLGVTAVPRDIAKFFSGLVRNVLDTRTSNNITRNDFINLLLEINKKAKTKEESLTFEEITAQSLLFFFAGFETSSSTMSFAFYEMAKNQDVQDKVREEIHKVLSKHDGEITYDAIMEMTYLGQVIDETLRIYPVIPTSLRVCTQDYKIPGEDVVLEKGTQLLYSLRAIHNDPEYYPNPEKFDPERFSPENKAYRHVCAYMPFGEGPRNCIGMRFGIMQTKIGLVAMLKEHRYKLNPSTPKLQFSTISPLLSTLGCISLDVEKIN